MLKEVTTEEAASSRDSNSFLLSFQTNEKTEKSIDGLNTWSNAEYVGNSAASSVCHVRGAAHSSCLPGLAHRLYSISVSPVTWKRLLCQCRICIEFIIGILALTSSFLAAIYKLSRAGIGEWWQYHSSKNHIDIKWSLLLHAISLTNTSVHISADICW